MQISLNIMFMSVILKSIIFQFIILNGIGSIKTIFSLVLLDMWKQLWQFTDLPQLFI